MSTLRTNGLRRTPLATVTASLTAAVAICQLAAAVAVTSLPLSAAAQAAAGRPATMNPSAAAGDTRAPEYRLGSGDVIRITVYQNQDLSLETRITENGVVTYPLLGTLRLGGLTVTAAERLIAEGLRNGNFVKQPQVTILLTQVRGNQASVLGQVTRPGRYPIEVADMRLSDFLAIAGGISATGADTVVVTGTRDGKPFRTEIDLPTMFQPGGSAKDMLILNGDILWVERQPQVYIYGEVQRPGVMRLERGMTLLQTLAAGGGLTVRGTERGIRVHRKTEEGKTQVITPTMDERLQDGDVVYVRESIF